MRISDLLQIDGIAIGVKVADKAEAIDRLVSLHQTCGNLIDSDKFKKEILKREEIDLTTVGMEIAVPHAKCSAVKVPSLAAITVPDGVDLGSPDGKPCKLIFMIAATEDGDEYLNVLSRLMQLLLDAEFVSRLKQAKSASEFLKIINSKEAEKFPEDFVNEKKSKTKYRVLAVTACPTGIAHTYMAAAALKKAAKRLGVSIKVETNGAGGVKDALTAEEISQCDGIIVAVDKSVDVSRFDGKPVCFARVIDGINKPEELITSITSNLMPSFYCDQVSPSSASPPSETFRRRIYKHLMNGVSHMLPFVVAGGIFIALAYLIDLIAGYAGLSGFGTVNEVAKWFKTIGNFAFSLMLPVLAGFIAESIADRPGLLVGIVGGLLATNGASFSDPSASQTLPSGFLGALIAGFAAGYIMKLFERLCYKLPKSINGIKTVLLYPIAGLALVSLIMCAVNPIMGFVNLWINDALIWLGENDLGILLGCILGGMMSVDMGGPFNKAAYVFATGALVTANEFSDPVIAYKIMASVMVGGMVPPLAIALSTTFFKNRWTETERKNGAINYIFGLSFITEGAIPYAAVHPLRIIPSCVVGSAIAGGLSWMFGCTLFAPHGGIFVVATVSHPLMYLLALATDSVISMLLISIIRKPKFLCDKDSVKSED